MHRAAPIAALLLLAVSSAAADTIVLKNGRRITAANVTDDGEHVSYETSAGRFTLPKSIVARIEKDQFGYSSSHQSDPPPVSAPEIAPIRGYNDIVRLAVHNDSIDFAFIARLEAEARSGSPASIEKVSAAHYTAAQFLLSKGEVDGAIDHYRQALNFAPENLGLLLNLSVLLLRQSQFTAALDPLEQARRVAPKSADVAKLTGWAYYGLNKMDLAVEEWQRAEHLHPDPEVERALAKAQKDKAEEESYREGVTAHFALKYSGTATPDLASGILHALEEDFNDIESQLDYTPPEPIGVILYTGQAFADITRARAPTWVQEGVAQWIEGRRSNSSAGALVELAGQGRAPSLQMLEGSWMSLSGGAASFAYAYALAAVESIIESGGVIDISRLLARISTAPSMDAALRDALHSDYSDLDQQTIAYLRHEYLR